MEIGSHDVTLHCIALRSDRYYGGNGYMMKGLEWIMTGNFDCVRIDSLIRGVLMEAEYFPCICRAICDPAVCYHMQSSFVERHSAGPFGQILRASDGKRLKDVTQKLRRRYQ